MFNFNKKIADMSLYEKWFSLYLIDSEFEQKTDKIIDKVMFLYIFILLISVFVPACLLLITFLFGFVMSLLQMTIDRKYLTDFHIPTGNQYNLTRSVVEFRNQEVFNKMIKTLNFLGICFSVTLIIIFFAESFIIIQATAYVMSLMLGVYQGYIYQSNKMHNYDEKWLSLLENNDI